MPDQNLPIRAAIDIGSNTIHMVVARCMPNDLEILLDQEELVRIGESVNATGQISPEKRDLSLSTLQTYMALARQHGAELVLGIATEAIRQATNSAQFLADIQRETGLTVHLIDGEAEATLTFYGATYELTRAYAGHVPASIGIMDLGGGSTELVTARAMQINWRTSLPVGSGWLHDRYLPSDPPTDDEVEVANTFLHNYFQGLPIKDYPPMLIATGGSANTLIRLADRAFGISNPEGCLSLADLMRCENLMRTSPSQEIAERYQQPPARVRILAAGTLIIHSLMELWQLPEIYVSPHGIREGTLLAYTRFGAQWLQLITHHTDTIPAEKDEAAQKAFVSFGRRQLLTNAHILLDWRKDVLRNNDIEAVHKMRVASRRLRAVLDAYETLCDPQQFKKVYRDTKRIASILGKARDTDVMIERLQAQLAQTTPTEQAGVQWVVDRLRAYRQAHQRDLEAFLRKFDDNAFIRAAKACLPEGGEKEW